MRLHTRCHVVGDDLQTVQVFCDQFSEFFPVPETGGAVLRYAPNCLHGVQHMNVTARQVARGTGDWTQNLVDIDPTVIIIVDDGHRGDSADSFQHWHRRVGLLQNVPFLWVRLLDDEYQASLPQYITPVPNPEENGESLHIQRMCIRTLNRAGFEVLFSIITALSHGNSMRRYVESLMTMADM